MKKKKIKSKQIRRGMHIEYTYIPAKDAYLEEVVFPNGHREMFRAIGNYIFGFINTKLGLTFWEIDNQKILEALNRLPKNAKIISG